MELKYRDYVKVTGGFYEGLSGYVTESDTNNRDNRYYVEMVSVKNTDNYYPKDWIRESYLEKIEE